MIANCKSICQLAAIRKVCNVHLVTPPEFFHRADFITSLKPNEVLVFGSNLAGMHGGFDTIRPYVDKFIAYMPSIIPTGISSSPASDVASPVYLPTR